MFRGIADCLRRSSRRARALIDTNANEIGKDLIYIDTNRIYTGAGTVFEAKSRTCSMDVQGLTRAIIISECTSKNRSVSLLIWYIYVRPCMSLDQNLARPLLGNSAALVDHDNS